MAGPRKDRPGWIRYSGIGVEFAAAVAGLTLLGYWIGGYCGYERAGLVIGAVLGIVGGGYNLIRESLAAIREAERRNAEQDNGDTSP
jgi:hypothetical protein